jgi:hypothetical protein
MKATAVLASLILATGWATAQTTAVWNPTANPSSDGSWNDAANWTGETVPDGTIKVVFNVAEAPDCIVSTAAAAGRVVVGDNGPGGTLVVTNGASLIVGDLDWSAIGYNNTGRLIVENGASATFGHHLWIGFDPGADGVFIMNGGTVSVAQMTGLGWNGGKGTAHINGGTLNLAQLHPANSIRGDSVLDVGAGTVVIAGDQLGPVQSYINSGKITGYGGAGSLLADFDTSNRGKTTITAITNEVAPLQVVWNPAANPSGGGMWNESANWTGGRMPGNTTKVVFNVAGAIACQVTNASTAGQLVLGDGGPGGTLIVTNSAGLVVGGPEWSAIGYNDSAALQVENGASVSFGNHLWIGYDSGADGVLIINGGTVSVGSMFGLGWNGGKGTARVNGGTLNLAQWDPISSIQGNSVLDVTRTGKVVITGDFYDSVTAYVSDGKITANGGSNVFYNYDASTGKTTIAADYIPPVQAVWNPAVNPDGTGIWNEDLSWTGGLPGKTTKVVFNVPEATDCLVTTAAFAGRVVAGDNGPGGTLVVTNGASLTVGDLDWSAIGYNNSGRLIVENGASATFGHHLWIGFDPGAEGVFIMNGGTVSVAQMTGLGWNGGKGTAHINGGTLSLAQLNPTNSIRGDSVLDLAGAGKVAIAGDHYNAVSNYVATGKITAHGGPNVYYYYDAGSDKTWISPSMPQQITGITVTGGSVTLMYRTVVGETYYIESTSSLVPALWVPLPGSTNTASGQSAIFTFPTGPSPRMFYRSVSSQ